VERTGIEPVTSGASEWLAVARAHVAGSSRLVLGGQAVGEN